MSLVKAFIFGLAVAALMWIALAALMWFDTILQVFL